MAQEFTLTLVNDTSETDSLCCYQDLTRSNTDDVMPVVWFAFPAAPSTRVTFSWTIDYQFAWSESGSFLDGAPFEADQQVDAALGSSNAIILTRLSDGGFRFTNQRAARQPDSFLIEQDATIPARTLAVGLNMTIVQAPPNTAGTAFCAVPSAPNFESFLQPVSSYRAAFGAYKPGQLLNTREITNSTAIDFPANIFHMVATLNQENEWTVRQAI